MEAAREAMRALGGAGLVAIRACGHWWTYAVPMGTTQMYDFARLNYRVPCPFCSSAWQARTSAQHSWTAQRVN